MNLNSSDYNKGPETKECPICYETCTNPVALPCCDNYFCMKCLDDWQPGLDNYVHGKRTCPCCRALIPPTQDTVHTIGCFKEVSHSIRILMQDPNVSNLPIPPGYHSEHTGVAIRHIYENIETAYGERVHLFEQKYGSNTIASMIPSTPAPIHVPLSVLEAVRANKYMEAHQFLGYFPIPPGRLNATCPSDNGNTILHAAVQASHWEIVKMVLALGADPNATNAHGQTPLYYAVKAEDCRVAKTLIRWGAKKVSAISFQPQKATIWENIKLMLRFVLQLVLGIAALLFCYFLENPTCPCPASGGPSMSRIFRALLVQHCVTLGAKKTSAILRASLNNNNSELDRLLAPATGAIRKPELVHILKHVEYGRHAKVLVNGVIRRGTILYGACRNAYHIQLDGCNETVVANTANVEICKPLLFDFRGIDRNALFPNLPAPPRAGRFGFDFRNGLFSSPPRPGSFNIRDMDLHPLFPNLPTSQPARAIVFLRDIDGINDLYPNLPAPSGDDPMNLFSQRRTVRRIIIARRPTRDSSSIDDR